MTDDSAAYTQHRFFLYYLDPEIEEEFQEAYTHDIRPHLRSGSFVSLLGWLVTVGVLAVLLPEHVVHLSLVIGVGFCPFLAWVAYTTYQPGWSKHYQWMGAVSNTLAGLVCIYLGHFAPRGHWVTGLLLAFVISFGAYMSRLRMLNAFLASLPYVLVFQFDLVFGYVSLPGSDVLILSAFLWMVALTAFSASSIAEQNSRALFAQRRQLQQQKEQLVSLNRQLQEASEQKSKFLAGMSHELRTPLNAIIGFTRIVRRRGKDVLPAKQVGNLEKVLVSSEHLLGLINDILDLSKIEAGKVDLDLHNFWVQDVIRSNLQTVETLVNEGVTLSANIHDGLPQIHSDPNKVKQIVLNLLSNAAKFTHSGEIQVTAQSCEQGVNVVVRDTGIGMTKEELERVFDEFQQANRRTFREYGGTGLGLSISKKLAERLGGSLTAESEEGKGSTFTLTIPESLSVS